MPREVSMDDVIGSLKSGVYWIKRRGRVVYIGKTVNLKRRVLEHVDNDYDDFDFKPLPISQLAAAECRLWHKHGGHLGNLDTTIHPPRPKGGCPVCD